MQKAIKVTKEEVTKFSGEKLKIAEAVFGDATGIVNARIVGSFTF